MGIIRGRCVKVPIISLKGSYKKEFPTLKNHEIWTFTAINQWIRCKWMILEHGTGPRSTYSSLFQQNMILVPGVIPCSSLKIIGTPRRHVYITRFWNSDSEYWQHLQYCHLLSWSGKQAKHIFWTSNIKITVLRVLH